MELRNHVVEVASKRRRLTVCRDRVNFSRAAWDIANQNMLQELAQAQADLELEETELRDAAVIAFKGTGERKPAPGVEVKVFDVFDYLPGDALKWAKEHGLALKLDVGVFEAIAKAQVIPFVTKRTEPRAQIARDLEKVLETAKEASGAAIGGAESEIKERV